MNMDHPSFQEGGILLEKWVPRSWISIFGLDD
jgi:hypothetical protein